MPKIRMTGSMRLPVTTTISEELHKVARGLNINWNEALARGVRVLAREMTGDEALEDGVTYEKDDRIRKLEHANKVITEHLLEARENIERLKNVR